MSDSRIVVFDASTLSGEAIVQLLYDRGYPLDAVVLLASGERADGLVNVGEEDWPLQPIEDFDFRENDICLVSGNKKDAARWVPQMQASGCRIIDDSPYSRTLDVPLVVPEIAEEIAVETHLAVPCAISVGLSLILCPIVKNYDPVALQLTSMQAVSGVGQDGIDALSGEVRQLFNQQDREIGVFGERIAFNLLPQIGAIGEDGSSEEETKLKNELPRLLQRPDLSVAATCVRVPVFFGHFASFSVQFSQQISLEEIKTILNGAPGVALLDKELPTPEKAIGSDSVLVGRLRMTAGENPRLDACIAIDNVRRGAALNTVELAFGFLK